MGQRTELHEKFKSLLGSNNVYYQPPETIKMAYPCIVYELTGTDPRYADDRKYSSIKEYSVTIIDKNPDSRFPDALDEFPLCSRSRQFTFENLHHFTFKLYF